MDLPDIFAGLGQRRIQEAFEHFRVVDVEAGIRIIEPGDEDATLVVVAQGDLQLEASSGALVGRAGRNDVVGEIAFYGDGVRKLGVYTRGPSRLLILDRPGYGALRAARHPVVPALEDRTLAGLEARFASVCSSIAQHGADAHELAGPGGGDSLIGKLFSMLGAGPSKAKIAAALAAHPSFADVDRATLERVAELGEIEPYERGDVLVRTGGRPERVSFVVSGGLDVACVASSGRGFPIARLGPGDGVGMAATLPSSAPSGVTVTARERTTVISFDPIRWIEATKGHDDPASALRIAAIRAGGALLWRAAVVLAGLESAGARASVR